MSPPAVEMVTEEPSSIAFLVAMLADATSRPKALLIVKVRQPAQKLAAQRQSAPPETPLLRGVPETCERAPKSVFLETKGRASVRLSEGYRRLLEYSKRLYIMRLMRQILCRTDKPTPQDVD